MQEKFQSLYTTDRPGKVDKKKVQGLSKLFRALNTYLQRDMTYWSLRDEAGGM